MLIGNSTYKKTLTDDGEEDIQDVEKELDSVRNSLMGVLSFKQEEIVALYDQKRIAVEKAVGKIK